MNWHAWFNDLVKAEQLDLFGKKPKLTVSVRRTKPKSVGNPKTTIPQTARGGPFIGPRGGKWADAAHTIPWKGSKESRNKNRRDDRAISRAGFQFMSGGPGYVVWQSTDRSRTIRVDKQDDGKWRVSLPSMESKTNGPVLDRFDSYDKAKAAAIEEMKTGTAAAYLETRAQLDEIEGERVLGSRVSEKKAKVLDRLDELEQRLDIAPSTAKGVRRALLTQGVDESELAHWHFPERSSGRKGKVRMLTSMHSSTNQIGLQWDGEKFLAQEWSRGAVGMSGEYVKRVGKKQDAEKVFKRIAKRRSRQEERAKEWREVERQQEEADRVREAAFDPVDAAQDAIDNAPSELVWSLDKLNEQLASRMRNAQARDKPVEGLKAEMTIRNEWGVKKLRSYIQKLLQHTNIASVSGGGEVYRSTTGGVVYHGPAGYLHMAPTGPNGEFHKLQYWADDPFPDVDSRPPSKQ